MMIDMNILYIPTVFLTRFFLDLIYLLYYIIDVINSSYHITLHYIMYQIISHINLLV